jgi:hypothetical protein
LARHFSLPSFLSAKRSIVSAKRSFLSAKRSHKIAIATAGALTVATVASLAATLPSGSSPAPASADAAYTTTIGQQAADRSSSDGVGQAVMFARMRSLQGAERQQQLAAEKAAAAKAAAAKAAAAKAAALKSAEQAAAARKAAAQCAQQAQSARRAAVATPSGSPEQIAEQMLGQFGWSSSQFSCLQPLWEHESGWSVTAENPTSGAYGIPQSLPAAQMASAGADWQTNAATQIRWGLTYIQGRYGSPCGAWAHEESNNWY